MKYKVGDIVKIKTWKEMKKEYGLKFEGVIRCGFYGFTDSMEKELNKDFSDRIVKIVKIRDSGYYMEGEWSINWSWSDEMIEGLISEIEKEERIYSRFDILDIR